MCGALEFVSGTHVNLMLKAAEISRFPRDVLATKTLTFASCCFLLAHWIEKKKLLLFVLELHFLSYVLLCNFTFPFDDFRLQGPKHEKLSIIT